MNMKRVLGLSTLLCTITILLAAPLSLLASQEQEAKNGDPVSIHFSCKVRNGEIAASSSGELPAEVSAPLSSVFMKRNTGDPIKLKVGEDLVQQNGEKGGAFESEIVSQLSSRVAGMKVGQKRKIELIAQRRKSEKPGEYILEMAQVRRRPKEIRMTRDEFRTRKGKEAEVNQDYTVDPSFPGKVVEVSENQVVIRFSPPTGAEVKTPFGKGIVKEDEKQYLVEIQAQVGSLVRSGPLVGRIVEVTNNMITIDYSHPFGGETLECEVSLEAIDSVKEAKHPEKGNS